MHRGAAGPLWVPHRAALVRDDGIGEVDNHITSPPRHGITSQ
ncbi:hypothetical protein [Pseudovibrio sp. JE062]|nr:hypothetical protein [Pseudovibrio sp. JE062]